MLRGSQDKTQFGTASIERRVNYDQTTLLKKINQYLEVVGGSPLDERGYCHGLSLLWLKRMAKRREQEFYEIIRMVINNSLDELINSQNVINKFIKGIDKKQNPQYYQSKPNDQDKKQIHQTDVNLLLKIPNQKVLDQTCLSRQLSELFTLSRKEGAMFSISNGKDYLVSGELGAHSVAVFIRDSMFYLYDANYTNGTPKIFGDADALVREIRICLFSKFKLRPPPYMPLEIKLMNAADMPQQFAMMESLAALWQSFASQLAAVNSYLPTFSLFSSPVQYGERDAEADSMDLVYAADPFFQSTSRR